MRKEDGMAAAGRLALAVLLVCSASCVIGFDTTESVSQDIDLRENGHVESWKVDLNSWNERRGELLVELLLGPQELGNNAPTELCLAVTAKRRVGNQWETIWEKDIVQPIVWWGGRKLLGSMSNGGEFLFEVAVVTPDHRIEWGQLRIEGSRDEVLEHAFFVW